MKIDTNKPARVKFLSKKLSGCKKSAQPIRKGVSSKLQRGMRRVDMSVHDDHLHFGVFRTVRNGCVVYNSISLILCTKLSPPDLVCEGRSSFLWHMPCLISEPSCLYVGQNSTVERMAQRAQDESIEEMQGGPYCRRRGVSRTGVLRHR